MGGRSRWLLGLVRLLAFCLAVVAARPATAAPIVDGIVLVAGSTATVSEDDEAPIVARSTRNASPAPAIASTWARALSDVRARCPTHVPFVVARRYLRNCSLLR